MRQHCWRSMQPNIIADDSFVTDAKVKKRWSSTEREQTQIELIIL